jgi:predicted branched-subunit amino acid permease
MSIQKGFRRSGWGAKLVVLALILALVPACQWKASQLYIPLAYALTGLCIALLMSPTPTAAVVGLVLGCLLGAAVYNNSLKRQIAERQKTEPRAIK